MINFEEGQVIKPATVTIDGVEYPVTPAQRSGNTPLTPFILNKMQKDLMVHKYTKVIETDTEKGAEVTLPCSYKVR